MIEIESTLYTAESYSHPSFKYYKNVGLYEGSLIAPFVFSMDADCLLAASTSV